MENKGLAKLTKRRQKQVDVLNSGRDYLICSECGKVVFTGKYKYLNDDPFTRKIPNYALIADVIDESDGETVIHSLCQHCLNNIMDKYYKGIE